MKVLLLSLLAGWLSGCSTTPTGDQASRKPGPEASFQFLSLDLGPLDSEGEKDVVFAILNSGDETLRVKSIDTTCGCARPRFPAELKPGEAGEIVVRFAPEAYAAGEKTEGVKVYTNARAEPYLLKFQVDLQPLIKLAPATPLVVSIVPGGQATQIVALTPRPGSGVAVESFESADPRVRVQRVPTEDGSFVARLSIHSPGAGDFAARLTLKANHPRFAALPYLLNVQAIRGPVSDPPSIVVSGLARGSTDTALPTVRVYARDRTLAVRSARSTDSALAVDALEPGAEDTTIRVRYVGGWKSAGVKRAELIVETDDPEFPTLRVPIEVNVL